MAIDLAAELAEAGLSPAKLEALLERVIERQLARHAAKQAASLEPLERIVGGLSARAATARIRRDPELRALGVRVQKRLLFRRGEVIQLYDGRSRAARGVR